MMGIHKATNVDGLEFWCNRCDQNLVVGGDSKTGSFFRVFGHIYQPRRNKETCGDSRVGEFAQILFAVCDSCLKMKNYSENEV